MGHKGKDWVEKILGPTAEEESAKGEQMDAQQRGEDNWRNIKTIGQNTQGSWKGDNADRFEAQFWAQFERDIEDHLRALQALDEAINRVRAEINE